jgi:hypothetical protein
MFKARIGKLKRGLYRIGQERGREGAGRECNFFRGELKSKFYCMVLIALEKKRLLMNQSVWLYGFYFFHPL